MNLDKVWIFDSLYTKKEHLCLDIQDIRIDDILKLQCPLDITNELDGKFIIKLVLIFHIKLTAVRQSYHCRVLTKVMLGEAEYCPGKINK